MNFLLVIESRDFKVCQKSTSSDINETWYDVRGQRNIHDYMTFKVIQGQGQGEEMTSVPYWDYFSENDSKDHAYHSLLYGVPGCIAEPYKFCLELGGL